VVVAVVVVELAVPAHQAKEILVVQDNLVLGVVAAVEVQLLPDQQLQVATAVLEE
jgi:hypothetical protein